MSFPYQFTYILINFFTIIVCLIFSYHPKIKFNHHFLPFIKASTIVGIPFILWDVWFTSQGVWWFDFKYTLGIDILGLPLEEWLFFLCIPFSCTFTYFCLTKFFDWQWTEKWNNTFIAIYTMVMLALAIIFMNQQYTFITALLSCISMALFYFVMKIKWLYKVFLIYLILMLGFIPVNGILTGSCLPSPVVNYNPEEIMNVRILTIPIEDSIYGFLLIVWNIFWFEYFRNGATVKQGT